MIIEEKKNMTESEKLAVRNSNFLYTDNAFKITPHIIESGKVDFWSYRKWSNGVAECWGEQNIKVSNNGTYFDGNIYTTDVYLPEGLFIEAPMYIYIMRVGRANTIQSIYHSASTELVKCSALSTFTGEQDCKINITCKGRWTEETSIGDYDDFPVVDQIYNPESANAQSGIAVAQAVESCSPAIVITSDTGKALSIPDSSESVIKGLTAYGLSIQDGTPTPDSPVEIVNVENPVINVYGKNLFDKSISFDDYNIYQGGYRYIAIYVGIGTTVTVSVLKKYNPGERNGYFYCTAFKREEGGISPESNAKWMYSYTVADLCNKSQTMVSEDGYISLFMNPGGYNAFKDEIMVEINSAATSYEPYIEPQTVTLPYTFAEGDTLTVKDGTVKINISGEESDITDTETGKALLALKTNYPSTSVISDIDLNITYKADTKNYIDNKIAELTALTLEG